MKLRITLLLAVVLALCLTANADSDYDSYLARHAYPDAAAEVQIMPAAYSTMEMDGAYTLEDGSLYTSSDGYVEYRVSVPADALYTVRIRYFPGAGTGANMQRELLVDGALPYSALEGLSFSRLWSNKNDDYKTVEGNQPFPSQVEAPAWREVYLTDGSGYIEEPLLIALEKGEHTLRLVSRREDMILGAITLASRSHMPTYDEYIAALLENGAAYYTGEGTKVQAEDAYLKSGPSFYPLNDRTSPLTEPYHYSNIVLNMIGGSAWNEPGEWLAWEIEAPESALYRIGLRFKQSDLRGLYATRSLSVNSEVPFAEARDLRFYDSDRWQFGALGEYGEGGELVREYWIYLEKGVNHVEMEVSLGQLGGIITELNDVTAELNALYREIVAITGSNPDTYRDYQLFTRMSDLPTRLLTMRGRVEEILARLTQLTGSNSERTAGMSRMLSLIDTMSGDEGKVIKNLSAFKECITSMGKAVLDLADQPLKIDYFLIYGTEEPSVRADANFFESAWHSLRAFAGSFTNDYNVSSSQADGDGAEIDVWLSTGRDQFDVIRRLINESFETEYGVKVNLKLIGADVVLPATATGNGPDAVIQIANSAPVNFAFRGAAYDLTLFDDYEAVAARFPEAALVSSEYEGGMYGLPDQMSYPVMFVRTDILKQLNLSIPQTWEELVDMIPVLEKNNMEIYLDTNPVSTLGAALSMGNSRAINTVFLSLLYQTGGEIYAPDGTKTQLDSPEAIDAFKAWTRYYTQHNFPQDIDFITRFRIGEVPIGIVDLGYYNTLAVSAPEIRSAWTIARVPGTRQADGTISHDVPCVTSSAMIVRNMAEAHGTVDVSWAFLKWWTAAETQTAYAREMEAVLGTAGRYLVANLESYQNAVWPFEMEETINAALADLHGVPQVPGGYITGRYVYNAFITVITEYENAVDTLFECNEEINREISKKRIEFGLITESGEERADG